MHYGYCRTGGGCLTGGEAGLLLPLGEVRVRVQVGLRRRRSVRGLGPALPLDQAGHAALSHGGGLRHVVLHHLGDTCREEEEEDGRARGGGGPGHSAARSPWREDRANAAISWMVRALLDLGNISTVSSTFT